VVRKRSAADGVTHIFEPHIKRSTAATSGTCGADRSVLFDSGLGAVSLIGRFPWLAGSMAIASHTHFDHVGNHHEFVERAATVEHRFWNPYSANTWHSFRKLDMFDRCRRTG